LNLDDLARRVIAPTVGDAWHGWHAFRRGLASNLNKLGADAKTLQELLRHGSMGVTMKHYVVIDRTETADAMQKLERLLAKSSGLKSSEQRVASWAKANMLNLNSGRKSEMLHESDTKQIFLSVNC